MTSSSSSLPPHLSNLLMQLNHSMHHSRPHHHPSQKGAGAVAASSSPEDECPLDLSKKAKTFPSIVSSSAEQEEDEGPLDLSKKAKTFPSIVSSSAEQEEDEGPLDLSKKAKTFPSIVSSSPKQEEDEETLNVDGDVLEYDHSSPILRSALSLGMNKSPSKVLKLSSNAIVPTAEKESSMSACSAASSSRSWSRTSSSESSPSMLMDAHQQYVQLVLLSDFLGNSDHHTLSFPPWAMPAFQHDIPESGLEQQRQQLQTLQQLLGVSAQQQTSPTNGIGPTLATPTPHGRGQGSGGKVRATRPFKAYPKDPMSFPTVTSTYGLPLSSATNDTEALALLDQQSEQSHQDYAEFRQQMLASFNCGPTRRASSIKGGSSEGGLSFSSISVDSPFQNGSLSSSKRMSGSGAIDAKSDPKKDDAYWEHRRKTNLAVKKRNDARRAKEDEIAIRVAFLEQENFKLRHELATAKNDNAKFRGLLLK